MFNVGLNACRCICWKSQNARRCSRLYREPWNLLNPRSSKIQTDPLPRFRLDCRLSVSYLVVISGLPVNRPELSRVHTVFMRKAGWVTVLSFILAARISGSSPCASQASGVSLLPQMYPKEDFLVSHSALQAIDTFCSIRPLEAAHFG